ncbi:uncharacterized protein LOC143294776 [Babylonia areolata]|uniref:uncharacterized protein LOC143294776 n=1 Tax=Babylonia areolata TaxID=304850 RepID=UPI003FD2A58B
MSAIPHRGPHVRELFVKTGPAVAAVGPFEGDQSESRTSYDLGGKRKRVGAPTPQPVGLGQYKPRILADNTDANIPLHHGHPDDPRQPSNSRAPDSGADRSAGTHQEGSHSHSHSRPFMVGDKDTPLVLHSPSDTYGLERDVRALTVSPSREGEGMVIGTSNPLFDLQETPTANGDVSVSGGKVRHYEKRKDKKGEKQREHREQHRELQHREQFRELQHREQQGELQHREQFRELQHREQHREPEGVYIPAPDYDEEEKTMIFSDEPDDDELSSEMSGKKIYREYYGEDFSQYLSDDENGLDDILHRHSRSSHMVDRKSKTEVKRNHYKKRDSLAGKDKKDKGFQGSSSLRNFSYADSKFGTLTASHRRPSVNSLSEKTEEAELFVNTGSSYEHFLCSKNGEGPVEAGVPHMPHTFTRPAHKKDTLWKKLTWKFKKQPKNGFSVSPSYS